MSEHGRLTLDSLGFDMPADAPLFAPLPHHFIDAEVLQVTFETPLEEVLRVLPPALEAEAPAVAIVTVFRFPFGTLGSYNEVALDVGCTYRGERRLYTVYNLVDNDAGLAAGREIWGVPKKQAHIALAKEHDLVMGTAERPASNRLFTALVRAEEPHTPPAGIPRLCLRLIPNVEAGKPPSVLQLVARDGHRMTGKRVWRGTGSLAYQAHSAIDPWHRFRADRILDATYGIYDYTLDYGTVLEDYLHPP